MNTPVRHLPESVGARYSLPAMLHARERSWAAVERIAAAMRPGMREGDACTQATAILQEMGMQRIWHQTLVRFGESTLKTFKERIDPGRVLGAQDIFFIDIGTVWDGHEGDAGATYVVGGDAGMQACAAAAKRSTSSDAASSASSVKPAPSSSNTLHPLDKDCGARWWPARAVKE